jgi:FixJ family two-component response regulator
VGTDTTNCDRPARSELYSRESLAVPAVYIVDDDVSVRDSLELLIRCAGWQPTTFASARDFLSRPQIIAPSCLILDVGLPDINGLDLQEQLAEGYHPPIIFLRVTETFPPASVPSRRGRLTS